MGYLQLAEGYALSENNFTHLAENPIEHYLVIPPGILGNTETLRVREDQFDNLPDEQFAVLMAKIAPYQVQNQLSEFDFESALNTINKGTEVAGKVGGILKGAGGSGETFGQKYLNVVQNVAPSLNAVIPGLGTAVAGLTKVEKVVFGKIADKRAQRRAAKGKKPGLFSKVFATSKEAAKGGLPLLPAQPQYPKTPPQLQPMVKMRLPNQMPGTQPAGKWSGTLDVNGTTISVGGGQKPNWFKEHQTEVLIGSVLFLGGLYVYSQRTK